MAGRPQVLFVGAHNCGRSQMAGAYLTALCGGRVDVRTAGAEPADEIDPVVVLVRAEDGIDLRAVRPGALSPSDVLTSDVVITEGGADVCPTSMACGIRTGSSRTRPARASSTCEPYVSRSGAASRAS